MPSTKPQPDFLSTLLKRGEHLNEIKLTREVEDALIRKVRRDFEDGFSQMREFRANMLLMNENWRGATDETKDFPFEDCSNIRVPLTSTFKEQLQARILKAFFSGQFVAKFNSLDKIYKREDIDEFNGWFDYELRKIVNLKASMRDILHETLVHGNAFPEPYWEKSTQQLVSHRRFPLQQPSGSGPDSGQGQTGQQAEAQGPPQSPAQTSGAMGIEQQVEIALEKIIGEVAGTAVLRSTDYGVYDTEDSEGYKGKVIFSAKLDEGVPWLYAEIHRREVFFDGAQVWVPNIEDYVVIPTGGTVEDVPFWGNRLWLSIEDFMQGVGDGYYRDFGSEENLRICACAQNKTAEFVMQEETNLQDAERGTDQRDAGGYTPSRKWIECYKWEAWWHLSDKAEEDPERYLEDKKQYAVWVSVRSWRIIKIARLEDLNKDAKRSPVHFGYIHEPNRLLDIGLAEWVRHVQAELDAIHNQRLDAGLLTNVPWGFYKPMAGFNREVLRVKVGEFKPVADPTAVVMPQSNWQPVWSFQEEGLVRKYGGEQAGLSEPSMGQFTQKRQSASEFVGTASAIDLRTEAIVEYLLESFHELVYRLLGLYQQFAPAKRVYLISGEKGESLLRTFETDRLQGNWTLTLSASLDSANKELQQKIALDMLQILANQMFIQMGAVQADTMFAALQKIFHEFGYEDVPIHKPDMPPMSDSPDLENRQMLIGAPVTGPTMGENFNEHLQVHSRQMTDPVEISKWGPDARERLANHIMATTQMQQMAQVIRQIQAAQANQLQQTMISKGIDPGQIGAQTPGAGAGPGTGAEGVGNPAAASPIPLGQNGAMQ